MARGAGVFGPYLHGRKYRIIIRAARDGQDIAHAFATEDEAFRFKEAALIEFFRQARTVAEAINAYIADLEKEGRAKLTLDGTRYRLRMIFQPVLEDAFEVLAPSRCARLYRDLTERKPPLAAATHHITLSNARTFAKWCMERRWLRSNPFEGVKAIGKANRGKEQLRIDEARKFAAHCLTAAEAGEEGALAALLALFLGMRAHEIVGLRRRDIDDNGSIVWITKSKTDAGRRALEVPEPLRPALARARRNRLPEARILPHDRGFVLLATKRLCAAAGVPTVCAHALRGTHATLAATAGAASSVVAASLGHTSISVTERHYIDRDELAKARSRHVARRLA